MGKFANKKEVKSESIKDKAAQRLLSQNPSNEELRYIMQLEAFGEQSWNKLVEQGPTDEDLWGVILRMNLREVAWYKLLERESINKYLCLIISRISPLRKQAWAELLKRSPTWEELDYIVKLKIKPFSQEAKELKEKL